MAKVETISVALTPEMAAMLRAAVASGEYASASEVVREALRDWSRHERARDAEVAELKRLVREGLDSGEPVDAEAAFARILADLAADDARPASSAA